MNASRMMARIATTTQKKNMTTPGTACPATVLDLVATAASYPPTSALFGGGSSRGFGMDQSSARARLLGAPEPLDDRRERPHVWLVHGDVGVAPAFATPAQLCRDFVGR